MRRKLISYDAFEEMNQKSLSNAQRELLEAEDILSCTLDKGELSLHCFGESSVLYETAKGTFVRADYDIDDGYIDFNNIEEIVIDEDSHNTNIKKVVSEMLDAILDEDDVKAEQNFGNYLNEAGIKLKMRKTHYLGKDKGKDSNEKYASNAKSNLKKEDVKPTVSKPAGAVDPKKRAAALKGHRSHPGAKYEAGRTRKKHKSKIDKLHKSGAWQTAGKKADIAKSGGKRARRYGRISIADKKSKAYMETVNHVYDYINYIEASPLLQETNIVQNEEGDVVSVKIPTRKLQNEAKLLSLKWDTLKTDVKVIRESALRLSENADFCKKVAELKRFNNFSDNEALTESLNQLVINWPSVLYLTQEELARTISEALEITGEVNYDDDTCRFMAEGILRVAHSIHPDRVQRLSTLAKVEVPEDSNDPFVEFQHMIKDFYTTLDESTQNENSILEDLRDIVLDIRHAATKVEEDAIREDAGDYLESIDEVLSGEQQFDLGLAAEVANWINYLIETNLETKPWNVAKTPYRTTAGEHPQTKVWAKWKYDPADDFSGDYGAAAPAVSDDGGSYKGGQGAKSMASSWSTKMSGGPNTYPSLNNPYVPDPYGDYKIKGEKHVDKDDATGSWQSGDTWPNLQNPYVPKAVKVHTSNDNRVDDVESRVGLSQTSDIDQKIR